MSRSIDFDGCTEEEMWRFVASHLTRRGIEVVLVGGAVVAVYTGGAYQSEDLDLVRVNYLGPDLEVVMGELGFAKQGRFYAHPD